MTSRRAVLVALAWLLVSSGAGAEPRRYVVDPDRSRIRFHATSRFMDADGGFRRFGGEILLEEGRPETASGRVTVEVASIDTGIRRRDDHLRSDDFLDTARHPQATFVVTAVRPEGERVVVEGALTIRGVTRPLAVPARVTLAEGVLRVTAELTVSRRAFGVAYQSWLNPIGDEVRMVVDLTAEAR
jgi:polyisoprenoid-binding protein YceI